MSEECEDNIDERQALIEERARELEQDFSYDGYQVVRKELFAHVRDPAVVIRRDSVTFNTACINGLEDVIYIRVMINIQEKKMAIRKCDENDKGALRWCIAKPDKRKSRRMTSREFTTKLYKDMGWDTDYRYKILGYRITVEGDTIYIFDLSETEVFLDTKRKDRQPENTEQEQEEQTRYKRSPGHLPEEWENSYGLPVEEQDKYQQINLKEGFVPISTPQEKKEQGGESDGG